MVNYSKFMPRMIVTRNYDIVMQGILNAGFCVVIG